MESVPCMDSVRTQIAYPDGCKCSLDVQRKPHGNDDGMHRSEDRLWRSLVGRDLACAIIIVYHTTTDRIKRRVQHARKRHGSDILVGNFNKSQRPTRSCRRRVSFAICSRAFASHHRTEWPEGFLTLSVSNYNSVGDIY